MVTPEGVIIESGMNRTRPFYRVEGDTNNTMRYEGKAKRVPQVPKIDPRDQVIQTKASKSLDTSQSPEEWMKQEIAKQ